jgi:uncharacterized protein YjbJ (UPF0337 family)
LSCRIGGPSQATNFVSVAAETPMSAQKSSEASEKIKGSVKEAIGKLIGDEKAETEGKAQQKLPSDAVKPNVGPKT